MKNYLIISLLFLFFGCSQNEYNSIDLIVMDDGLYTVKFSDKPISGKVYGYYGEEGNLLKGKKEGTWKYYAHYTYKKFDMVLI